MKRKCQLLDELYPASEQFVLFLGRCGGLKAARYAAVHRHHIWGGTSRLNLPSNLIDLCVFAHEFVHAHPVEGRIACMWKRKQMPGFSIEELNRCAGKNVLGWLESHPVDAEPFSVWREELLSTEADHAGVDPEEE